MVFFAQQYHRGSATNVNERYFWFLCKNVIKCHWSFVFFASIHGSEILDVVASHDNGRMATAGLDRKVFLTDVSTGKTIRKIRAHDDKVRDLNMFFQAVMLSVSDRICKLSLTWILQTQSRFVDFCCFFINNYKSLIIENVTIIVKSQYNYGDNL